MKDLRRVRRAAQQGMLVGRVRRTCELETMDRSDSPTIQGRAQQMFGMQLKVWQLMAVVASIGGWSAIGMLAGWDNALLLGCCLGPVVGVFIDRRVGGRGLLGGIVAGALTYLGLGTTAYGIARFISHNTTDYDLVVAMHLSGVYDDPGVRDWLFRLAFRLADHPEPTGPVAHRVNYMVDPPEMHDSETRGSARWDQSERCLATRILPDAA